MAERYLISDFENRAAIVRKKCCRHDLFTLGVRVFVIESDFPADILVHELLRVKEIVFVILLQHS